MRMIDPNSAKTLLPIIGRRRWQSDRSGVFRSSAPRCQELQQVIVGQRGWADRLHADMVGSCL
jgi:hypothetical protein